MNIFTSAEALQQEVLRRRNNQEKIGFVPTMGYLHSGHTSLLDIAREQSDWLVCSIYVNPLQFAPDEDLEQYPQDLKADQQKCLDHGVDALFIPTNMYHANHNTYVQVEQLSTSLCGGSRPSHFHGVTTVVARLFGIVQPHIAVFGEKDFQQLTIIRRMVRDLAMPIQIIGGSLIRDTDGLALSSRNRYLTAKQRQRALSLSQALRMIKDNVQQSETPLSVSLLCKRATEILDVDELDYLEIVDPSTLQPLKIISGPARALIAAWVGTTRLIDNWDVSQ